MGTFVRSQGVTTSDGDSRESGHCGAVLGDVARRTAARRWVRMFELTRRNSFPANSVASCLMKSSPKVTNWEKASNRCRSGYNYPYGNRKTTASCSIVFKRCSPRASKRYGPRYLFEAASGRARSGRSSCEPTRQRPGIGCRRSSAHRARRPRT